MSKRIIASLLLAKIQPTAATDSVPTAAANAMLVSNLKVQPLVAGFEERNNIQPYMGNQGKVYTGAYSECSFDVELQASGTAGTAPKFGPLLRACGFAETLVAVTSAAYAPITSSFEMVTLYYYLDGLLYIMTDAKGTVSFSLNARGIPKMSYKFTGFQVNPTDTVFPAGTDYSGFKDPIVAGKLNTPTFTLHSIAVKVQSFSIDMANAITYRRLIGSETVEQTDRSPTGSISMELDTVAVKAWTATVKAGTLAALAITHGIGAGYLSSFAAPKVQITDYSLEESDGIAMMSAKLQLQPNAGNDELVLTFT